MEALLETGRYWRGLGGTGFGKIGTGRDMEILVEIERYWRGRGSTGGDSGVLAGTWEYWWRLRGTGGDVGVLVEIERYWRGLNGTGWRETRYW